MIPVPPLHIGIPRPEKQTRSQAPFPPDLKLSPLSSTPSPASPFADHFHHLAHNHLSGTQVDGSRRETGACSKTHRSKKTCPTEPCAKKRPPFAFVESSPRRSLSRTKIKRYVPSLSFPFCSPHREGRGRLGASDAPRVPAEKPHVNHNSS